MNLSEFNKNAYLFLSLSLDNINTSSPTKIDFISVWHKIIKYAPFISNINKNLKYKYKKWEEIANNECHRDSLSRNIKVKIFPISMKIPMMSMFPMNMGQRWRKKECKIKTKRKNNMCPNVMIFTIWLNSKLLMWGKMDSLCFNIFALIF